MDLTNTSTIKTTYAVDEDTNILTVTFKDETNVTIGTIEIENLKYRTLIEALLSIAQERIVNNQFKGSWNAETNTPVLANTGMPVPPVIGDVYLVTTTGTQNLGGGSVTYYAGTWMLYDGSKWVVRCHDYDGISSRTKFEVLTNTAEINFV